MGIVHISGMDATGKSTICSKISEKLNCNIYHFDKPKNLEDGKQQYFDFINNLDKNKDVICDRFHDGEHIYSKIYRGYESNYLKEFETELRKHPYLFVNTTASLSTIIERIKVRGEDYVKEEDYQKVLDLFERYVNLQSMSYIKINTDNSNINDYINRILNAYKFVNELYNLCVNNNYNFKYYGNIEGKYLIIANDKNDNIIKENLIKQGIYDQCWITEGDDNFIQQFNELCLNYNIKKIVKEI